MAKFCDIHIATLPVHKGQYKPVQNGYYGIMIKNLIIAFVYIVALRVQWCIPTQNIMSLLYILYEYNNIL